MISTVGTSLPYLKFYHCAFQDQFESLFNQAGFPAVESNLPALSFLINNGGDQRGDYTNDMGMPVRFNGVAILNQLDMSKPTKNNCAIA